MNWATFNVLRTNAINELGQLHIWAEGMPGGTVNQGPQPFASVSSWARWANGAANPPVWPANQAHFNAGTWGADLKQSVIILAANPAGVGAGPDWANFHYPGTRDYRLVQAFGPVGGLRMLSGAYMTDILKTERGTKIGHPNDAVLDSNARMIENEIQMLGFAQMKLRLIVFLGPPNSPVQNTFQSLIEEYGLAIHEGTHATWIYHHAARIKTVTRTNRIRQAALEVNHILTQAGNVQFQ